MFEGYEIDKEKDGRHSAFIPLDLPWRPNLVGMVADDESAAAVWCEAVKLEKQSKDNEIGVR